MRISDWSSDVCSSDLRIFELVGNVRDILCEDRLADEDNLTARTSALELIVKRRPEFAHFRLDLGRWRRGSRLGLDIFADHGGELGIASCRERVCPYVEISVFARSLKKIDILYLITHPARPLPNSYT